MIYYYELPVGENPDCGEFKADDDKKALEYLLSRFPSAWCLYRESDTPDGTPFAVLYDYKEEERKDEDNKS